MIVINKDFSNQYLADRDLSNEDFSGANLKGVRFDGAYLQNVSLKSAFLQGANFKEAILDGADLTDADLTGANLSGASLRGVNLTRAIGIGDKQSEIAFAKSLLWSRYTGKFELDMEYWRPSSLVNGNESCRTACCIAGFAFPNEVAPGQPASLLYPTLAQYFFSTNEEALEAIELVATGKLSVFPD